MEKYVALLRGINISGKNKISMAELKLVFQKLGLLDVVTYINSGNVIFSSDTENKDDLIVKIKAAIMDNFKLDIPVTVVSKKELIDIIKNAPKWWGTNDKEIYDNTIFMISPTTVEEVYEAIGDPKLEYEKVDKYNNVIFWSANLKNFSKTKWSKIASSSVNNKVTIRNANTVKKLLEIIES